MSDIRALVLGAGGQLGQMCMDVAPSNVSAIGLGRSECDITDPAALKRAMGDSRPQVVINAAAYTAVDQAEQEADAARAANADAPALIADLCGQYQSRLVHVSTDFVFDGKGHKPYLPEAQPAPLGVYGQTKWQGEQAVLERGMHGVVLRTSWVYAPSGRNFVLTMLRLMRDRGEVKVVSDQIGSPTSTRGLAEICWALALDHEANGIFHWSDAGAISWFDFACAIRDEALKLGLLSRQAVVESISSEAFPTKAQRPAYSVLDASATCLTLGVSQQPWRDALRDVLRSVQHDQEQSA